jgi:uncharacterized SAM-dependent methyltransferase
MLDAYDDSLGVTAAFNLNLLARINRELGGNLSCRVQSTLAQTRNAEHRNAPAFWCYQNVTISRAGLTVTFREGERSDGKQSQVLPTGASAIGHGRELLRRGGSMTGRCETADCQ